MPPATQKKELQPDDTHSDLTGLRVLFVDDDRDTLEMVLFLLEQEGLIVTAVTSAKEAIDLLMHHEFDILLSDIGMPDIDGFALLTQAQTLLAEQRKHLPAITLTAYAGETVKQQALAAGFQMYISKPVDPETLISAIAQVTQGSRA